MKVIIITIILISLWTLGICEEIDLTIFEEKNIYAAPYIDKQCAILISMLNNDNFIVEMSKEINDNYKNKIDESIIYKAFVYYEVPIEKSLIRYSDINNKWTPASIPDEYIPLMAPNLWVRLIFGYAYVTLDDDYANYFDTISTVSNKRNGDILIRYFNDYKENLKSIIVYARMSKLNDVKRYNRSRDSGGKHFIENTYSLNKSAKIDDIYFFNLEKIYIGRRGIIQAIINETEESKNIPLYYLNFLKETSQYFESAGVILCYPEWRNRMRGERVEWKLFRKKIDFLISEKIKDGDIYTEGKRHTGELSSNIESQDLNLENILGKNGDKKNRKTHDFDLKSIELK